jgi:hypothetical protein
MLFVRRKRLLVRVPISTSVNRLYLTRFAPLRYFSQPTARRIVNMPLFHSVGT